VTLKAVVENLDDVPENLRTEYKEVDGKFYLDLDNTIREHTVITPLVNSLATLKNEKKTLSDKLAATTSRYAGLPDDFEAQRYNDIVTELEALKKDPNRDKDAEVHLQRQREQYEQRVRDAETKRLADIAEKDGVIGSKDAIIEKLIVDDGLTKALVSHNIGPQFLRAAAAMLRASVKMEVDDDTGERRAVVDTDLGRQTVDKYIEIWSKSDEGKPFVVKAAGSGAPGSSSGNGRGSEVNPWAKDTINLTQQGVIVRTDRMKARRLMAAAGIPEMKIVATLGG